MMVPAVHMITIAVLGIAQRLSVDNACLLPRPPHRVPFRWFSLGPKWLAVRMEAGGTGRMVRRKRLLSRNLMEIRVRPCLEGELKPDADKGALRKADANTPVSWASQE